MQKSHWRTQCKNLIGELNAKISLENSMQKSHWRTQCKNLIGELNAKISLENSMQKLYALQLHTFKSNCLRQTTYTNSIWKLLYFPRKDSEQDSKNYCLKNNASWWLVHSHLCLILLLLIDSVISLKFNFLTIKVASFQQYTIATTLKQLKKDLVKLTLKK